MDLTRLKVGNTERADDRLSIDDIARLDSSSRQFGRRGLCRGMIRRERAIDAAAPRAVASMKSRRSVLG